VLDAAVGAGNVPNHRGYGSMERLVARLVEQGIDPLTFKWYVVTEGRKPTVRAGTQYAGTPTLPRLGSLRGSIGA
jgi:hypothetical protein